MRTEIEPSQRRRRTRSGPDRGGDLLLPQHHVALLGDFENGDRCWTMRAGLARVRVSPSAFCAHGHPWPIAMKRDASGDLLLNRRAVATALDDRESSPC